jgi:hypothetical protein
MQRYHSASKTDVRNFLADFPQFLGGNKKKPVTMMATGW